MKLYIKSFCPWCVDAVKYLDDAGYSYEKLDVLQDQNAYAEMTEISGQRLTPTLDAGGKVLADFDVDQLEAFLAKHDLRP